jgi:hypothetical protein
MGLQLSDPSPTQTARVQTDVQSMAYGRSLQLFAEVNVSSESVR